MKKQNIAWTAISLCIAVLSVWMVLKQSEQFQLSLLLDSLREMNKAWLMLAIACMFGFIWFEGAAITRIARALGILRSYRQGMVYGAADVYFSAITPSATGGQPASAYFMIKDGMKGSVVTVILLLNLIMYNLALLSVGGLMFLLSGGILRHLSAKFQILFVIGACVIIFLSVTFCLMLKKEYIIYSICDRMIHFFEKIRLIGNTKAKRRKLITVIKKYKWCAEIVSNNRKLLIEAFLLNILQRLSQLGVSLFIFLACKKTWAVSLQAMAVQSFVTIGSNCIPIPGGIGVADFMMLDGFTYLVGSANAVNMELMCRGISFYSCVVTGCIVTVIGYFTRKRKG